LVDSKKSITFTYNLKPQTMTYQEIKQEIIEAIYLSERRTQDNIDDIALDIINDYANKEQIWMEILEDGAFGWLVVENI
jgi:Ran GTPase-activating protein (RanGAP) involved in mRNA processing and transport